MNETDLTHQIRDLLHAKNIWHKKIWQGPMSDKGVSDIIGIYKGKFLAIEVKGPRAPTLKEQTDFIHDVNNNGGIGFFAWSVEDVIRELGIEGVRL